MLGCLLGPSISVAGGCVDLLALREVELHPPPSVLHLPLLSVVWVCTLPGADHVPCLRAHTPLKRITESQGLPPRR